MTGTLYAIGLGPGAPDLLTLRAVRLIAACPVIAYPAPEGGESLARAIAAPHLPGGQTEIAIALPMRTDRAPAQAAYEAAAPVIAAHLAEGRDVALLCEGDPLFYGSAMYLLARLSSRFATAVVPGVTSVSAASAVAGLPLVARSERLEVLPGPLPDEALRARLSGAEALVILKVGRHLPRLRARIEEAGLAARAVYVERASLPDQRILPLAQAPEVAPYFSLILIPKGDDPWL